MMEFEDAVSERMAQLEQEDLERYQRDILRNSKNSYAAEKPSYDDEFQRKLPVLLDMVRGIMNSLKPKTSSTANGSDSPMMIIQPVSYIDEITSCNNSDFLSEPAGELHSDEELMVTELLASSEMTDLDEENSTHDAGSVANEKESDLPTMNSDLGSQITDEHLSDEELMVNESPKSAEMLDSDDIKGNDFSNSTVVPDLEEHKLSKSGFKVLSIYCAHMATKWRPVLDSQPIQGNDMSVEVYYEHFFNWKRQLEEVNYIGDEESYVDDFIYGLEIKLGMRVCGYKWKPHTLFGAFRRAVIEESLMKNAADMLFEEMPHPNFVDIQGAGVVSDEYVNDVLGPSGDLIANGSSNGSTESWFDEATLAIKIMSGKCVIVDDAYKVFGEITQTIRAALLNKEVIIHCAKYVDFNKLILFDPGGSRKCVVSFDREVACLLSAMAHEMFIFGFKGITSSRKHANSFIITWEMLGLLVSSFAENQWGLAGLGSHSNNNLVHTIFGKGKNCVVSMSTGIDFPLITESPETSIAGLQEIDGLRMLIFDPGINPLQLMGCAPLKSSEMPSSSAVFLWVAKVLFYFNMNGCCLLYNVCDYPEFKVDQGDCCLDTFIYVLRDKVIMHKVSIWIVSLGGIILLTDHILYKNGLAYIDSVAGLYGDKATISLSLYILAIDNDKINRVFVLFSILSSYITQYLRYKGVVLWVGFNNFPSLSRLEPNPQVVDPSTGANKSQLNENIGQRNLYGSMLFTSKEYFVYTTSDQASPRLNNGHDTNAGNTKVHFTATDMLSQRFPFGDKYCFIASIHFLMFVSDSPAIIYLVSDNIAQGVSFFKSLFEGASCKLLITLLSCWTEFLDRLTNELGFMSSFESRISSLPHLRVNFVWDPGDAISLYIIEDNDVLMRKGIWIQVACALKQDDVKLSMLAMQMAQMLQLVEYGTYPYDHGSYTIMASENTWHDNFYPSSNVAYTNVLQRDVYGDVQNRAALGTWLQIKNEDSGGCCMLENLLGFVWDPGLQMSIMEEESDNQHLGFWFGEKVPCVCSISALVLALFPVSCDSYSMWQCHIKMQRQAVRSAPKMQGKITAAAIVLLFSIIFGISRFMSCALQPYPNALAGWLSIYKYNESAVWDPGVRISTTLRTRRFLRGRCCHE